MKKTYKLALIIVALFVAFSANLSGNEFLKPKANDSYRIGRLVTIQWDTTEHSTNGKTLKFYWAESANPSTWSVLPMPKGKTEFVDGTAIKAIGSVNTTMPNKATNSLYIKLEDKNDPTLSAIVGPITVTVPAPSVIDSTLKGDITGTITLSANKIYGLDGVLYVQSGATLRIEPGTVIKGDNTKTSAICINRGGKIYANGTAQKPIVMTSGLPVGQRDRGDWGGLLIMGRAKMNLGESPIEGGIADASTIKKNAWFGGDDDQDSSGVLRYVRVEFAGIAESPDNELNGITFGAVGSKTVVDYVQVSYSGDDSFEWFGGTVNCKHLVAYNGIDDDFDTDNGYRGKLQFGVVRRFNDIADVSNSEAFESDNDANATENQPFTQPIFSNFTVIGSVSDTSNTAWTPGADYSNRYHPRYLAAAQIRRNSRMSLHNSIIVGWPAGLELTGNNTVRAANADSVQVRNNSFFGIRNNKFFYAGSSTVFSGNVTADWLKNANWGNELVNGMGNTGTLAGLHDAFSKNNNFNPSPKENATYLANANFDALTDSFFDKVSYRGANGLQRWDIGWTEYDPNNKDYVTSVEIADENVNTLNINVSPMPATDYTNVRYYLPSNSNVSIKLFDVAGSLIASFNENDKQTEGFYEFTLATNELSAGVYHLAIITENGTFVKNISVIK